MEWYKIYISLPTNMCFKIKEHFLDYIFNLILKTFIFAITENPQLFQVNTNSCYWCNIHSRNI